MAQVRLKGPTMPSHSEALAPRKYSRFELKVGRRYPIAAHKALEMWSFIVGQLHEGERLERTRMSRYIGAYTWHCWTTEGRRIEVTTDPQSVITGAAISDEPDPNLPPKAR